MGDGYTKIKNDLFQNILPKLDLNGSEFRVLMFIIWNTLCFKRKYHDMSEDYIAQGTGLSRRQVIRAFDNLCKKKLVRIRSKGIGTHPNSVELSCDIFGNLDVTSLAKRCDKFGKNFTKVVTEEIKEEIKDEEIKEKEKEISLSGNARIVDMSDEEWKRMNEEDFDDE